MSRVQRSGNNTPLHVYAKKQGFGALTITLAHADMKLVIDEWKD